VTERFDEWLETGLRDLEEAVPLGQSVAFPPEAARLVRVPPWGTRSRRPVGSLALVVAVILVLAALASRLNVAGPGASQSAVPTPGGTTSSPTPSSSPSDTGDVTHDFGVFSIVTPASWHVITRTWTNPPGPFLFVSNAVIADPCPTTFLGAQCLEPLAQLPPEGIVVTFDGSAGSGLPNPTPIPMAAPLGSACLAMAGEREQAVLFPGFGVTACLRGPDFTTNESAFARLVASIPGPPPPHGTALTAAFTIPDSGITLSPPGDAVPRISSDAAYELCRTPGGASCQPGLPTSIELALITDTGSTLVKPNTLVWAMGWLGVTTCISGGGAPTTPGNPSPSATPGPPALCDAYNFIDAQSGKYIFGMSGPHH
jgi:hypothetical protein